MKTNTFSHLENLCAGKRIVCERRGKVIELTTPCGGTTAECDSVAEALDTVATDPTFSKLPIVMSRRELAAPFAQHAESPSEIRRSDARVVHSIAQLRKSARGIRVLALWKVIVRYWASDLDSQGWYALQTLVNETAAGRRDYLDTI